MRSRVLRTGFVVGLALTAVTAAGCGGGRSTPATTPTTTSTTRPGPTTTSVNDGVEAAYRAFWDVYLLAADPMEPEHPALGEVATGEQLKQVRSAFLARKSAGEVIRGELDLKPSAITVDGDTATLTDCYLDRTGVYRAQTGERVDKESGVRHLIRVRLVREGGAWKVAAITKESNGCVA